MSELGAFIACVMSALLGWRMGYFRGYQDATKRTTIVRQRDDAR